MGSYLLCNSRGNRCFIKQGTHFGELVSQLPGVSNVNVQFDQKNKLVDYTSQLGDNKLTITVARRATIVSLEGDGSRTLKDLIEKKTKYRLVKN